MDYEHFFRPLGLALDIAGNFHIRANFDNNRDIARVPQAPLDPNQRPPESVAFQHENEERLVRTFWWFGYIPLPVVNYPLLWRRCRPAELRQVLLRASKMVSFLIKKLVRAFIYIASIYFWLSFILNGIASSGNMVTFSSSFFSDIFTFSLRNYPSLITRHHELTMAMKSGNLTIVGFENTRQFLFDNAALKIQVSCPQTDDIVNCELVKSSLIFKLSDILVKCYSFWQYLPSAFLTTTTIFLYILYAVGAQILNINIVALVTYITWKRQLPLTRVAIGLVKSLWAGAPTNVI